MFYPNKIRETRLSRGISQIELGNRVGISYGTMCRYENGHVVVPIKIRKKLSRILKAGEADLFPKP